MLWIMLGVLAVLFVRNHYDVQGVKKDLRGIARTVRKAVQELIQAISQGVNEAKKEKTARETAVKAEKIPVQEAPAAAPVQVHAETEKNNELLKELEQKAMSATMLANVPTIDFPADDPKYDSSRKYAVSW